MSGSKLPRVIGMRTSFSMECLDLLDPGDNFRPPFRCILGTPHAVMSLHRYAMPCYAMLCSGYGTLQGLIRPTSVEDFT